MEKSVSLLRMGCIWSVSELKYFGCVLDESGTDEEGGEWKESFRCY